MTDQQDITNVPVVVPGVPPVKTQPEVIPGESNISEQLITIRDNLAEVNGHKVEEVMDPILKARKIVVDNYNDHRNPARVPAMTPELVNILWFSGTRWNFKAICEFTVVKDLMYVVSWNARRGEGYLDIYKKNVGIKITDS